MIRCRLNSAYLCTKQIKMGKSFFQVLVSCETCPIFRKLQQRTLLETDPNHYVRCPQCEVPFKYYKTPTTLYRCKYCGSFVWEKDLMPY